MTARRDLIVVGASMGGIPTLQSLLGNLPTNLPAAVLVVQHRSPMGPGHLAGALAPHTALPVSEAKDGEPLTLGEVRLAPPNRHLLVSGDRLRLVLGPTENRARPSIDALFRSAAAHHGPRVLAALLSGLLDDGSAGIAAVQRSGGVTAIQSPEEALHPELPDMALRRDHIQHVLTIQELAELIARLAGKAVHPHEIPEDVILEARITERVGATHAEMDALGEHTAQACPECGGPMWRTGGEDEPLRFRCHIGHVLSAPWMAERQRAEIESSLFVALRVLDERSRLLAQLADQSTYRGQPTLAEGYRRRAKEVEDSLGPLRDLLAHLTGEET